MRSPGVLSSYTFRFIAIYVAGLSLAVFVTLGSIYSYYSYNHFKVVNESMREELDGLETSYSEQGQQGLVGYIDQRTRQGFYNKFFYLAVDRNLSKLAGNLDAWPAHIDLPGGWLNFELDMREWGGNSDEVEFVALSRRFADGVQVIAAREFKEVFESSRLVWQTLIRTMLATLLFGLLGGLIISHFTMNWIAGVRRTVAEIASGNLSERIDPAESRGTMRGLILQINQLLETIESLMQGVRQVSDNIAHDLRTPLTRMRHQLEQLQDSGDEFHQPELVAELIGECDELLLTFAALLRIARLEAGNRSLEFSPVKLNQLAEDVAELYQPLAEERDISLAFGHGFDTVVRGDRDLLFQMLANLVDNAVKYSPVGGRVELKVGSGLLSVIDGGPGIPAVDHDNVFQRFFRLESSRGLQPGNGLGLSLVKAVVDAHGGEIRLSDNKPGLRVDVFLPVM
ncbi:MAG: signal transduction histidine kinase [Halieaceae bacterium]|jgi:signal transduction histidine kinase